VPSASSTCRSTVPGSLTAPAYGTNTTPQFCGIQAYCI
jgi:hypothetical protein